MTLIIIIFILVSQEDEILGGKNIVFWEGIVLMIILSNNSILVWAS